MNLGDSNLKFVNTSKPQLIHTPSKQSVTASDDYYSFTSEGSSGESARRLRLGPSREALKSEATIPPLRPVKHTQRTDDDSVEKPAAAVLSTSPTIRRKPVSSSSSSGGTTIRRPISEAACPPTPNVDDTPYIQFAIDQLTRDQEISGAQHGDSEVSYAVDRVPTIPAIDKSPSTINRALSDPEKGFYNSRLTGDDVLLTAERRPRNSILHYVPRPLRLSSVGGLMLCCFFMVAALIYCAVWPARHIGLAGYDGVGTTRYFIFQYLPQLLGSVVVIWLLIIQCAIQRTFPFAALASGHGGENSGILYDAKLIRSRFLLPDFGFFRHREMLLGLSSVIFWLALFTVPLQSCLFQTRYYMANDSWRWTTEIEVAWTLIVIYIILATALALVLFRFNYHHTGLRWDPTSLADIMVMFHRSNLLPDFERSEIEYPVSRLPKTLRLGYWKASKPVRETFYCVGDENAPIRRYSLERGGKLRPVQVSQNEDLEAQRPIKASTFDSLQSDIYVPAIRYGWIPWFLKETFVLAWIVIAITMMLAFVAISFANQAVQNGFLPLLPAPTTKHGFSPADFLYSFLPSFIGMILYLGWQPIDAYFRAIQPYASLTEEGGSLAERSLLLEYSACLPFEVTIKALANRHYKVAWVSFIGIMSITLPILAGGVFTAQFVPGAQNVFVAASMPGFKALVVFVIIYALSFVIIWPTKKRYLPHDIRTLGQIISFLYQSPLLVEPTFRDPKSKVDLVTKLMCTPVGEKSQSKYAFGVYKGRDGKEHLGIDLKKN